MNECWRHCQPLRNDGDKDPVDVTTDTQHLIVGIIQIWGRGIGQFFCSKVNGLHLLKATLIKIKGRTLALSIMNSTSSMLYLWSEIVIYGVCGAAELSFAYTSDIGLQCTHACSMRELRWISPGEWFDKLKLKTPFFVTQGLHRFICLNGDGGTWQQHSTARPMCASVSLRFTQRNPSQISQAATVAFSLSPGVGKLLQTPRCH